MVCAKSVCRFADTDDQFRYWFAWQMRWVTIMSPIWLIRSLPMWAATQLQLSLIPWEATRVAKAPIQFHSNMNNWIIVEHIKFFVLLFQSAFDSSCLSAQRSGLPSRSGSKANAFAHRASIRTAFGCEQSRLTNARIILIIIVNLSLNYCLKQIEFGWKWAEECALSAERKEEQLGRRE